MKPKLQTMRNLFLLVLVSILFLSDSASAAACTAQLSSMLINYPARWEVSYKPGTYLNVILRYIRISFTTASGLAAVTSSPTCMVNGAGQFTTVPTGSLLIPCYIESTATGFDVVLSGLKFEQSSYDFTLSGIYNAPSARTVNDILCTACSSVTCTSTGPVPDPWPNNKDAKINALTFSPDTQSADSITVTSDSLVNSVTDATTTFKIKIKNKLPKESRVVLTFPYQNQNYLTKGAPVGEDYITKACCSGVFTVTGKSGSAVSMVTLPIKSFKYQALISSDTVEIFLDNQSEIIHYSELEFVISPTSNPPSLKPIKGFSCETKDVNGYEIEKSVGDYYMHTDVASTYIFNKLLHQETKMYIKDGDYKVGATGKTYVFQMYLAGSMPMGAKMTITFPSAGWALDCSTASSWPAVKCLSIDCKCTQAGVTCDAGLNALSFTDCWPTTADYVYAPGPVSFELANMVNPISIKEEYFQMATFEMDGSTSYKIDETSSLFFLAFTMGDVYCYSVIPTDPTIFSSLGAYNFTMAFQHDIPSDYILHITLPNTIPVLQKAGCPVVGLGSPYTCAADSANGIITISGLVDPGKTLPAMTNITFSIQQTLQNPGAFIAPGKYTFLLTTAAGGDVDGGTYTDTNTTHYLGSTIVSFSAAISSTAVGAQGVSIFFTLQPLAIVPKGAYFVLTVPEQFEPEEDGKQGRDCMQTSLVPPYAVGLTGEYQVCSWDYISRNMTLTGGFSGGPTVADSPLLQFTVPGWQNPRSASGVNGTGKFNITIYTEDKKEMYRFNLTEGPWFRIEELQKPASLWYSRTSLRNGVQSNFTFTFEPANDLYNFDIITITLPYPVRFTILTKCIGQSYWISGDLNCTISQTLDQIKFVIGVAGVQLKAYNGEYNVPGTRRLLSEENESFLKEEGIGNLVDENNENANSSKRELTKNRPDPKRDRHAVPTVIPKGNLVEFVLTSISSPPSLKPASGSVKYLITTNDGSGIEQQTTNLPVGNTEPGMMLSELASAIPNFMEKGSLANYTIKFVPINFEPNMKIIFTFPPQIIFPSVWNESAGCIGLQGLSQPEIICKINQRTNTIIITNGLSSSVKRPEEITIEFLNLTNPTENVKTDPFQIETTSSDGYLIDVLQTTPPLFVNFYCSFPCQTCNETVSTECFTCYTGGTPFLYLYKDQCRDECPAGMYEQDAVKQEIDLTKQAVTSGGASVILYNPAKSAQWETKIEPATCKFCKSPCATCGNSAEDCLTCIPKYLHYPVKNTCYAEIHWYFPFLAGVVFFAIFTILISGCARTMNVITSLLPLYCLLEAGVWVALIYLYVTGEVSGERPLSIMSLAVHVLLNLFWIFVHYKLMMQEATGNYLQLFKAFKCSSWFFQGLAYFFNFKFSVLLVSNFAGRPRFSGTYSPDSWQKFNIFSVLYIALVYLPFTADFYLYFIEYGLRQLTSYVALEACALMTVISMILLLLLLQECSCTGIEEKDLGGRAGLKKDKSMSKKKRRALRSGMGNEEGDYDDEYDSEEDYYDEDDGQNQQKVVYDEAQSLDEASESQSQDDDSKSSITRKGKGKKNKQDKKNLDMLEQLATQMKEERDILEAEKAKMVKEEQKLLKEKKRQAKEYEDLRNGWAKEKKKLRKEVKNLKSEKKELIQNVDDQVHERLGAWDGNPRKDLLGNVIVALPPAIYDFIDFEKEIEGDEEYWLQNLSAIGGDISDRSGLFRERDASLLEHVQNSEAALSYLGTGRSMEADQEQRAVISQGGIVGDDLSAHKSMNATEQAYLSKDEAAYGQIDKSLKRNATEQEYLDNASAIFSHGDARTGKSFEKERDGTDIEQLEGRSAEFGSVSAAERKISQRDASQRGAGPVHDQEGHSGESDEGIVADHTPFNGIKDAIANQERLRQDRSKSQLSGSDEDSEADEDNRPSGRQRRIKQVLYSDKSESSVDEMMQDTPSNYNIANGRLEGKSMGLKAILLFAKNQGVNIGGMKQGATGATLNQLAQIQEESVMTPQDTQHPNITDGSRNQLGLHDDYGTGGGRGKTKPTPGMAKRFKEPAEESHGGSMSSRNPKDGQDLQNVRKNNFV